MPNKSLDNLRDSIRAYLQDCSDAEFDDIYDEYDALPNDTIEDLLLEEVSRRYPEENDDEIDNE